jgi:ribosomal protein S18 acetylase RimI-like enzyme
LIGTEAAVVELLTDRDAVDQITAAEITELTRRATETTYYADALSATEVGFIERVVRISADCALNAARRPHQHLVAALNARRLAGFVIATAHAEDSRELDWLMVDPDFHGAGVASPLMRGAMAWRRERRPMWLNVVRHNDRAIRFYRKHGFQRSRRGLRACHA